MKALTLHEAREYFKIRSNMNRLRANFKQDKANKINNYMCVGCGEEQEINAHVLVCKTYEQFRNGMDIHSDRELVAYFCRVMQYRSEK